jgi:hypothetical protein
MSRKNPHQPAWRAPAHDLQAGDGKYRWPESKYRQPKPANRIGHTLQPFQLGGGESCENVRA